MGEDQKDPRRGHKKPIIASDSREALCLYQKTLSPSQFVNIKIEEIPEIITKIIIEEQ